MNFTTQKPAPGDVVGLETRNHIIVDCVVVSVRHVNRGRRAGMSEYSLAPLGGPFNKAYGFKVGGERFFVGPNKGWSDAQIEAALEDHRKTSTHVAEVREEVKEKRQEQFSSLNAEVGDEVLIKYTDGKRWKKVAAINEQTGKVGIENPRYSAGCVSNSRLRSFAQTYGDPRMAERVRDPHRYTWIDPRHIVEVRKAEGGVR